MTTPTTIAVRITRPRVTDSYGIPLAVGTTYTLPYDFGFSLISNGGGVDANNVLATASPNDPYLRNVLFSAPTLSNRFVRQGIRNNTAMYRIIGSENTGFGTGLTITGHLEVSCKFPWSYMRVTAQYDDAAPVKIVGALVSPKPSTVAFPGVGPSSVIATFGGATTYTNPTGGSIYSPQLIKSDWMLAPSAAPDSSGNYYGCARILYDGTTAYSYYGQNGLAAALGALGNGDTWKMNLQSGVNGVASPGTYTNAALDDLGIVVGIDFITSGDAFTLCEVGDSTSAGTGSVGSSSSAGVKACQSLCTAVRPVSSLCAAIGGASMPNFITRGKAVITSFLPTAALIQCGTINDPVNSQAKADEAVNRAMEMVAFCIGLGVFPILTTGYSNALPSAALDQFRKGGPNSMIGQLKALALNAIGWALADTDAATSDPARPWALLPAYDSGVAALNYHPNDAGYQAAANVAVRPILAAIV